MATAAELALIMKATDKVSPVMKKLQKNLGDVQKSAGKVAASFGVAAAAAGISGLAGAALSTGFAFNVMKENATLAFTTLLGDGTKAAAMIGQIEETAKKTPFEFTDLVQASQRMLAFGFAATDVLPTLTAVGDAVSAMGGGADMVQRVTLALGQMKAKGKVSGDEMMQLAEAGIPAWQILADNIDAISPRMAEAVKAGKITSAQLIPYLMKMAEAGQIPAEKAISALVGGMKKKFGGLGEAQSKTVAGAVSTFADSLKILLGDITSGPFGEVAGWVITLGEGLDKLDAGFKGLSEPIKEAVSWLGTGFLGLLKAGGLVASVLTLAGALGIGPGLTGVVGVLSGALGSFVGASGPLALLAGAFLVAKLGWDRNLQPVFDALNGYLKAFPNVKVGLDWANDQAKTVAKWILGLGPNLKAGVDVALAWVGTLASAIGGWISGAASAFGRAVTVSLTWVGEVASAVGEWIQGKGSALARNVQAVLSWGGEIAGAIGDWFQGKGAALSRNVQAVLAWGGEVAGAIGDWFQGKGEALSRNVQTFLLWGGEVAGALGDWIQGKGEAIGRNVQTFLLWAGELAGNIGAWVQGKGEALGRNISAYILWAGELAGKIGEWVAGTGASLGRNISAYLLWAGDLAGKIGSWLAGGVDLGRTIKIAWDFASDAARKFFNWIVDTGGRILNVGATQAGGGSVPAFAGGGAALSPMLAMVGDRPGGEAILGFDQLAGLMLAGGGGTGRVVNFNNYGMLAGQDVERWLRGMLDKLERKGA